MRSHPAGSRSEEYHSYVGHPIRSGDLRRAAAWTVGGTVITIALQLGYTLGISRLLPAASFGLFAILQILVRLTSYLTAFSIAPALIQRLRLSRSDVVTAATLANVLAAAVAGLLCLLTEPLLNAAGLADGIAELRALAPLLVLNAVAAVSGALLRRQNRFRAVSIIEMASYALAFPVVGLGAAMLGLGVWSLVLASLTQATISAAACWALARNPLLGRVSLYSARQLLSYAGALAAVSFVEWLSVSLTPFGIARILGAGAVGVYNRSTTISSLVLERLVVAATKVVSPAMSALQDDDGRTVSGIVRFHALLVPILVVAGAGMVTQQEFLVGIALGGNPEWAATYPVLPWVVAAAGLALVSHIYALVLDARRELSRRTAVQLIQLAIIGAGTVTFGLDPGKASVAVFAQVWFASEVVRLLLYTVLCVRLLHMRWSDLVASYLPGAAAVPLCVLPLWVIRLLLGPGLPGAIAATAVVALCALAVHRFRPGSDMAMLLHPVLRRLSPTRPADRGGTP